ncbi:MAG TPA: prenyltransferase/squalene oxidase repeat-containing protein [Prolixibacteraceae bacterium]|nr:prenyltransferase/squalene oxidase repeat-containing protein [Prolixibacteraceae bacterium]
MTYPNQNIPFYLQLVSLLRKALDVLDKQGQTEVFQFLKSQQNADGGFKDRGGRSDLYYSLFGMLLLRAIESEVRSQKSEVEKAKSGGAFPELVGGNSPLGTWNLELETKLKYFVERQSSSQVPGFIEQCCLALLQKELRINRISRTKTLLKLTRSFWKERYSINLSYRSFVLFLTLDAVLPFRELLQRFSGKMLSRVEVNEHSPCSEIAAKVFLLKMLGKDGSDEQQLLVPFASESGGFRAFQHLKQSDMLSTAVALFALQFAGYDLRLLKPASLDFIQQNYLNGAFLSGDGDQTTDLEYTFYGLLALGTLAD